jgi:nitric oxide dioxygenase
MPKAPVYSPAELSLLRESYAKIAAEGDRAAALFYRRLFALNPALRGLFHGDMREQGRKLMSTLGLISTAAERLDELVPTIRQLGVRHAAYRVKEAHYETVGMALLGMISEMLGATYTEETGAIWGRVYTFISTEMIDAARQASELESAKV